MRTEGTLVARWMLATLSVYMWNKRSCWTWESCFPSLPQAQRSDELDIHTDDELEILEWDDGDGWCKGRDRVGKEGYFPQSYVQPSSRSPSPPHSSQGGQQQQRSLSSSSAKDTNNNCNGNGKPLNQFTSLKHNCKYSIGCVIGECWERRNVYKQ